MKLPLVCVFVTMAFLAFVACETDVVEDPSLATEKPEEAADPPLKQPGVIPTKQPTKPPNQPTKSPTKLPVTLPSIPMNTTTAPFWRPCTSMLCWLDCVVLQGTDSGTCLKGKCVCHKNETKVVPKKNVCIIVLCWLDCVLFKRKKGGQCTEDGDCQCSKDVLTSTADALIE